MSTNFVYGSGNPLFTTPVPVSGDADSIANKYNVDMSGAPSLDGDADKPKKSGIYTRTYNSSTIPDDTALVSKINQIFKQYYGRDANQSELAIWLPQLKNQYKSPSGKSKTTIKETYRDGQLVNTEYLTADNADPAVWLDTSIKGQLVSGKQTIGMGNVPEGPSGKFFTEFKNFAAKNGIMLSDSAATDYANKAVAGVIDADTVFSTLRESAASAFPQLADKIKSGIDLRTLADPYIQSMSNLLEIPYTAIDLFDPKIRGALSYTQADGKVGTKSIYDFEKELRKDVRWQYTNNAKKEVADTTLRVLQDFGFQG
jgi:hypothetical protein